MTLLEKMQLYDEELNRLKELNDDFLRMKVNNDIELELFLLERERCLIKLRLQPIQTADKMRLKMLQLNESLGELEQEDAQLVAAYRALLGLHRQVVRQEQAVSMQMRGIQKELEQEMSVETKTKKRRLTTYTQHLQQQVSVDAGMRFDRRR